MKIGIIYFCGIQIKHRHFFNDHLQIVKDTNPRFFNCLNKYLSNKLSAAAYLINDLKIKEHWDQIVKELNDFGANNDILVVIGESNSKYIPRCLGNNWFRKLLIIKSEGWSGFAIRHDYDKFFKLNFSGRVEKMA